MTSDTHVRNEEVMVDTGDARLPGLLDVPEAAGGLVIFAHGSGSSRFSRRNRAVAATLQGEGLATLLFDLLTDEEDARDRVNREHRFDIGLLDRRLTGAVDWAHAQPELQSFRIGLFGASTGAAGALIAAARRPALVRAVVSRGGRPDLAEGFLDRIGAPTLLIVGGLDAPVIDMNRSAAAQLRCEHRVEIVEGATHLFEEPGKLGIVAGHARDWFVHYLGVPGG